MFDNRAYQQASGLRRSELEFALRRASAFTMARTADEVAAYTTDPELRARATSAARRLYACANSFRVWRTTGAEGETVLAFSHKLACNLKAICMLCARRHSARLVAAYGDDVAAIQALHPNAPFVMVTLTLPNVPLDQLGDQLDRLHDAHTGMMRLLSIKRATLGWMCSTEITFPVNATTSVKEAHAHLHDLWCCVPEYFSRAHDFYISQEALTRLWSKAAGAPEETKYIVDIRRIHNKQTGATDSAALKSALREVLKYVSAGSELTPLTPDGLQADPAVAAAMFAHAYRRRFLKLSGVFAEARKRRPSNKDDPS